MPSADSPARPPLDAGGQALAEKYLPLARSLARPYKLAWPWHRDDFESAACGGLVEAAASFDPARGVKFSTFVRYRIWGALRDVQRQMLPIGYRSDPGSAPRTVPLGRAGGREGIDRDDPDALEAGDRAACEAARDLAAVDDRDEVEALLRQLPPRHAVVCRRMYVAGEAQHQAARALGWSPSHVSALHRQAMTILMRPGDGPPA